ncbi:MAG: ion transporter [Chloroflexota bacterium]|nr:ion transporter [Chloroflexota bacterium]
MTGSGYGAETERDERRRALAEERESLRVELFDWLDPVMTALGLVTLVLLLVEFAADLSPRQLAWVNRAQQVIWAAFAVEFAVQFALAPRKLHFLRTHWLAAIAVVLPALRVFRALRAARALRSLRLVRLVGGTNRAMKALRQMLRGRQFGYLVAITLLAVAVGTVGIYFFERDQPEANIRTLGDALWWASCMVTTINNERFAVSAEGRVLAVLLRVYAAAIFGLVTANIASYFVGKRQEEAAAEASAAGAPDAASTAEELRRLREEVRTLTRLLERGGAVEPMETLPSARRDRP